ncbi:MAG: universal stress protein [Planctomycetota bacterium]
MKYRRILVPTDFSTGSESALRYACRFARCTASELVLLHVLDLPLYYYRTLETQSDSPRELRQHAFEQARAKAQEILTRLPEAVDIPAHIRVRTGSASREIIAEVQEEKNIDLVIIATSGRSGISHALLGSVAEKVIRTCSCPVITLREGTTGFAPDQRSLRGVLCPSDASKLSEGAFPTAVDLCQRFHAPLHVLHVLEDLSAYPMVEWAFLPDQQINAVYEKAEADARASIQQAVEQRCSSAAIVFDVNVRRGHAADGIVEEAKRTGSDLIVMMTHGRTGFEHSILGSVAERVARTATCPVLTLRVTKKKEKSKDKKKDKVAEREQAVAKKQKAAAAKSREAAAKVEAKKAKQAAKAAKQNAKKTKEKSKTKRAAK